jgi:hypothetical protein
VVTKAKNDTRSQHIQSDLKHSATPAAISVTSSGGEERSVLGDPLWSAHDAIEQDSEGGSYSNCSMSIDSRSRLPRINMISEVVLLPYKAIVPITLNFVY